MKKLYPIVFILGLPIIIIFSSYNSGSPGGKTASIGDGGITCTQCHTGSPVAEVEDWISTTIPEIGYTAGETYTITTTGMHENPGKFGFEFTAEDESGNKIGNLVITNSNESKLTNGGKAVTHSSGGTTPNGDTKQWTFDWTAPVDFTDDVYLYAAFNAANGNGNNSGDIIYKSNLIISSSLNTIDEPNLLSNISIYPNPSKGIINMDLSKIYDNTNYEIFNITGQLMDSKELSNKLYTLNYESFPDGVYFIRLSDSRNRIITKKLIIN